MKGDNFKYLVRFRNDAGERLHRIVTTRSPAAAADVVAQDNDTMKDVEVYTLQRCILEPVKRRAE